MTAAATLIAEGRAYGAAQVTDAEDALADAISAVQSIGYYNVSFNPLALPATPGTLPLMTAPTMTDVTLDLPAQPSSTLVFQDIPAITVGAAPTFSAVAPTPGTFSTPSQLAEFQATLPTVDLSASFPTAPSLIVPEAPTMGSYTVPTAPTTVLPTFGGAKPADIGNAPSDLAGVMSTAYHEAAPEFITMINSHVDAELTKLNPEFHSQMGKIEAQLSTYLAGGTGLKPAVEDAIYSRARSKNNAEALRVRDQSLNDAATRGFTLPSGALMSAMRQARQSGADNNSKAASEITVMQAEMEQKNLQFAVTSSTGLRTAMVSATLNYMQNLVSLNGQAMSYAQNVVSALVETYNATVRAYTARLDGYKTEAGVFQTLIQAALASVEVYKAEIQALTALTQVDMTKVNVYKARIEVLTSLTGMYRTQVEAAVSKASLEKLKIDVFQAQVQAYSAQVSAKNAQWQGYTAQIAGDTAKVQAFGIQAQAYSSQVNGYKASIDAQASVVQAASMTNDARAKIFVASLEGYKTVVQAKGEVARTQLENQRQKVVGFQAEVSAAVAQANSKTEYYKATSDVAIKNGQLSVEAMLKSASLAQSYGQTIAQLHSSNAGIHASLAGAAMAGMNMLAVESFTE